MSEKNKKSSEKICEATQPQKAQSALDMQGLGEYVDFDGIWDELLENEDEFVDLRKKDESKVSGNDAGESRLEVESPDITDKQPVTSKDDRNVEMESSLQEKETLGKEKVSTEFRGYLYGRNVRKVNEEHSMKEVKTEEESLLE